MKKSIGTYFAQYFKTPHLYRDDLKAIEKVIREDLKPKRYSLACKGFEFDGIDDIPADIDHAGVLVIHTYSPWLRLKFARSWAELYSGDDGSGVDDAVRKIAFIVSKCERRWLWAFCKYSTWLAPLVGFGSLAVALGLIALDVLAMHSLYLVVWLLIWVSLWWAFGHHYSVYSFSRIDFHRPRGRASALSQYRVKIALFLAAFALGGATLWLFAKYFHLL
jgi:hypothetical protein